jgi:cobalt/nickel transport system permease protein
MHVPDGFVDIPVAVVTAAASLGVVAVAVRKTGKQMGERTIPLLGVTAAFIFAAQMLNFPVAAGTSGHFLGAMLAAAFLGPWAATVTLTVVVTVQALVMADGGITALGANVLNMAIVAVFVGYGAFLLLRRLLPRTSTGYLVSLAISSWLSIVAAAAACAVELAASGTLPLRNALPAMVSVHMVIGLGEALITVAIASAVLVARPDLVGTYDLPAGEAFRRDVSRSPSRLRFWSFVAGAFVVAAALAVFVSPFASGAPDGLESVAIARGAEGTATGTPAWQLAPLPDYQLPGVESQAVSTALAGLIGTAALFAVVILAGRALGRRRPKTESG